MAFKASENLAGQIAQYVGEKIIQLELKAGERKTGFQRLSDNSFPLSSWEGIKWRGNR